jgi:hypothetical protein
MAQAARSMHPESPWLSSRRFARLVVPYDDWEVLYRIRLQVEVELRRGSETAKGHGRDGTGPLGLIGELLRRIVGGSPSR